MNRDPRLRIAVIGAGISGLVAARGLDGYHDVTLFEAEPRPGGHTHTVDVDDPAGPLAVDTGFIIFNAYNYPRFTRLLQALDIASQPTDMSFSVRCDRDDLEWCGSGRLNQIFGQRRNLLRPRFWRMLGDILRFAREARGVINDASERRTIGEFAADRGYGHGFVHHYLLPMGASLWSCPEQRFADFPVRFVAEFMDHHCLLDINGRPQWQTIPGGSRRYVDALLAQFNGDLRLGTPVLSIRRRDTGGPDTDSTPAAGVAITTAHGVEHFDEAILACHADQSLTLVHDADATERELLAAFPFEANEAILHTDIRVLPRRRRCWAAWNHRAAADGEGTRVSATYNMNILQSLDAHETWCLTLNDDRDIDPTRIARRIPWSHPLFTLDRGRAQDRHAEMIRRNRLSWCGAWWGWGFHEDGVASATRVLAAFGLDGP